MKELVGEVEKKLQILLTISIFFPVLMTTYFGLAEPEKGGHEAFALFGVVAPYLAVYVLFEISKRLPPLKLFLQALDWALLMAIVCYIANRNSPVLASLDLICLK